MQVGEGLSEGGALMWESRVGELLAGLLFDTAGKLAGGTIKREK